MEEIDTLLKIIISIIAIIAAIWGYLKLVYRIRERFFYITNCSILPISLWEDVVKAYNVKKQGEKDQIYQPLLIIPRDYKSYFKIKNGKRATLEFQNPDGKKYIATAVVYWIPENSKKWSNLEHPAMSLVLRRYFGIERPLFRYENNAPKGWNRVEHGKKDLEKLHRDSPTDPDNMIWAVSDKYSIRFYNPLTKKKTETYKPGTYIEYCGLSLKAWKKSIFVFDITK